MRWTWWLVAGLVVELPGESRAAAATGGQELGAMARQTRVSIAGESFCINGEPTYAGRTWRGHQIEGLLLNSRMVQGTFDDLNPETRVRWAYPDGPWDAERNTREFLAAMPEWRAHGLVAFTLNFQGGSPQGYSQQQPWINSAFTPAGELRPDYCERLRRILDRADELGMVVILGYLYFGQEPRFEGEAAVLRAVDAATDWVLAQGYRNVVIETANEANVAKYHHEIVKPPRQHELMQRVRERSGGRLLVSCSMGGGAIPPDSMIAASDFLLLHGNGVKDPNRIREMVATCRQRPAYRGQPIVFNEDDHFEFDQPDNNFIAAVSSGASWGYFDFRMRGEGFAEGYQSVPVDWGIHSARKRGFFGLLKEMTGS